MYCDFLQVARVIIFPQGPGAFQFLSKDRPLAKAFAIGPKKPAMEVITSLISSGTFFNLFLRMNQRHCSFLPGISEKEFVKAIG